MVVRKVRNLAGSKSSGKLINSDVMSAHRIGFTNYLQASVSNILIHFFSPVKHNYGQ